MPIMPIIPLHCHRCGYDWPQRLNHRPAHCPACNSLYWDRPRTRKVKKPAASHTTRTQQPSTPQPPLVEAQPSTLPAEPTQRMEVPKTEAKLSLRSRNSPSDIISEAKPGEPANWAKGKAAIIAVLIISPRIPESRIEGYLVGVGFTEAEAKELIQYALRTEVIRHYVDGNCQLSEQYRPKEKPRGWLSGLFQRKPTEFNEI